MIVNRLGVDLSHYNGSVDPGAMWAAGVRVVFHKASESLWADDKYAARRAQFAGSGHDWLWGAYHFGRGTPTAQQVEAFFKFAQPDANTCMAYDWEVAGVTTPMARDFLQQCDQRWGRTTCLYSYMDFLRQHLGTTPDAFFGLHPLWLAAYTSGNVVPQASWDKIFLWQYSDGQAGPQPRTCPGVTGDTDENSFDGVEADLRAEWDAWMRTGLPNVQVVAPPPPAQPQTTYNGDRRPLFDAVRTVVLAGTFSQRQVSQLDAVLSSWAGDTSRKTFFDLVRDMTPYGRFTQAQVTTLDAAITAWQGSGTKARHMRRRAK